MRKEWLITAGLFDEDFKEYGWEDLELGARLRKLGLQRKVNPRAMVFHLKKDWYAADLAKKYLQAEASARSAFVYLHKSPGLRTRLATNIHPAFIAVNDCLRLANKFFQYIVQQRGEKPLTGFSSLAAQILVSFHYFAEIKKQLVLQGKS